ncbi:MAG TPA: hypothetical protein DDY22_14410 [Geobacter sp.]|nr:hypothetical protein [Geobacter sp.]
MTAQEILDGYFLENRARLLEIASFLDRLDRAPDNEERGSDFRYRAFIAGLELLMEPGGERTRAIQLSFSDPTTEPLASAAGLKATGAWQREEP